MLRRCGSPRFRESSPSRADRAKNLLHWPKPLSAPSYAIIDSPRFHVPEWATVPWEVAGATLPPELRSTNGYDFTNNVHGDTYVWLLGTDLAGWTSARTEFLQVRSTSKLVLSVFS